MNILNRKGIFYIFFGDLVSLVFSLYIALLIRNGSWPSASFFSNHLIPFGILSVAWFVVFYIAGLYDKQTIILKSRLPSLIFNSQIINSALSVLFFYIFPVFGITPKTVLLIYLAVSFVVLWIFRIYFIEFFYKGNKQSALLIGYGQEMKELLEEVNQKGKYNIYFSSSVDLENVDSVDIQEDVVKKVYEEDIKFIAIDFSNEKNGPLLKSLYNLVFSKVRFIDSHKVYEDVFDRIPLSLVTYSWFLENISVSPKFTYDLLKRLFDIFVSSIIFVLSLVLYPIVWLLIKIEDGGKVFIRQERVGQGGRLINILKFRTMSIDDGGEGDLVREKHITRIGNLLRKTRIDELPQLINVLKGDLSLIGPRPELPNLVRLYEKDISFYNVRHLIKPGLSGWAQLYQKDPPKFGTDYNQTKVKLSYDLFYIKNRSFILDIKIALKTVKVLLSKSGV
jgi:exopolysaccharide biosynthesis polyprenyl glycosylphosphotransferase